ncbi:MAG: glycosyltransferase [Anaerolineae bacterium]|nr:glycosyltransferase [Anaerolineae bacterium]
METDKTSSSQPVAVVIFAHNEAPVIKKTVQFVINALKPNDALFVVADNCTDETASIAQDAGACVLSRDNVTPFGKGAALSWLVKFHRNTINKFWQIVILDADTIVPPNFVDDIRAKVSDANNVHQCFVYPIGFEVSPISTLIALSEIIEQSVFNNLKSAVHWPVRLRGTGMVIPPSLLCTFSNHIRTDVEDIVLTLLFSENNIKISQLSNIFVYDPKPTETSAASRQRARWFRGQWSAFWLYRNTILHILSQGIKGWSLISTIFLKPRWLMICVKFCLALVFLLTNIQVLAVTFGMLYFLDVLLIGLGILISKERVIFLKTLVFIPAFVIMWLCGIRLSFQRLPWLRVRDSSYIPGYAPFTHPGLLDSKKLN